MDNINGQLSYIIKVESTRPQYEQSRTDALYFILALIAFGLLFIMVVLLILERLVISRISNLSSKVSYIGQKGDLSSRVNLSGKDEISSLAKEINKMLENLEQSRRLQKESETFNYALLQDSPNPIEVMNPNGSIRYVNPALERITGYSQTQLIGRRPPFPWWVNENTQQYLNELRDVAARGVQKIERNFRTPQGDPFWVEITSTVIRQDKEIKYYISNWVDITVRKQAEQALRESENRFRELAELLPELVFEIDIQAKLIFVNRVAFTVFGYPGEDYSELNLTDLIAPEYRASVLQYIKKIIAGEHIGNTEYVALRKDETRFPAFIHTTPIKNSQGEVTGLRGILVDITTQKEIEAELRASEEFSSSLLNNAPNPIIVSNVDSSIRYINPAMEKLTGFSSIDVIGKTAPHPWWLEGQSERFDQGNSSKGIEKCYRKKNGELFWVTITNNPFIENGKTQYYVGNWVDITERKRTEDALRASENFSSSLSDNSPYPLMVINPDTTIRYVNSALEKLTGYSAEELIGQKPPYPFWSREQTVEYLSGINRDILSSRKVEALYLKKSGESFYVDITSTPIMEGENIRYSLSIWVDITVQKLASEQLEQLYQREKNLREALQSEIRSRAEFTRALVHELKTPLTPIMASSELLVEELTEEPFLGLARNVHRGAENMNRRVDELLDLARGDVGMLKVNLNPVDPEKLLNEVIKYMEPSAKSSGQSLSIELPEKLPIIMADDDRVRQILFNLITNSIKYSSPGGHIKLSAREEEENLVINIQDTGRGMSEEEQQKLFQPYYRIEGRERLSGLGLGLALSKRLVELQNGRIWVHSQKGAGSTFSFSLPIKTDNQIENLAKTGGKS
jgi:PAS domain S-box-containing protein